MKCFIMIWHVVLNPGNYKWNNFSNKIIDLSQALFVTKLHSWKRSLTKSKTKKCLVFEWCVDPLKCVMKYELSIL